jgi:hypothetical protein
VQVLQGSDWWYYNFRLKGDYKGSPTGHKTALHFFGNAQRPLREEHSLSWIALVVLRTCYLKNSRPADFVIDANSWKPPTIPLLGWGIQISCTLIDDFNSIQ